MTTSALTLLVILVSANLFTLFFANYRKNRVPEKTLEWQKSLELDPEIKKHRRSVVLFHGFVGSPYDLKPLISRLRQEGYRIVAPLMPGTVDSAIIASHTKYTPRFYIDWALDIVKKETAGNGVPPHLVGFSLGGTLALSCASHTSTGGLVLIAPYFSLPHGNAIVNATAGGLKWVLPAIPKVYKGRINDPRGYARYEPGSYRISLFAFNHLNSLARQVRTNMILRRETACFVLSSPRDCVASNKSIHEVFDGFGNVILSEYPASNHILLYDYDRKQVIDDICNFLTLAEKAPD